MNLFVTGFPGFIGSRLVPRLVETRTFDRVLLLVEPRFTDAAGQAAAELLPDVPFDIVTGDITRPRLGIDDGEAWSRLRDEKTEWWHLAALYRLDAPLEASKKINVEGTRNVLETAKSCKDVHRMNYVSTAYVSGRTKGVVREDDLPEPKSENFKNYYEQTKNEAEWVVRKSMDALPTTIYRFGVVTGDSKTGETSKFDGPYFIIKYFDVARKFPLPRIGRMTTTLNVVPVDFVIEASCALAANPDAVGMCYQIVDPNPLTTGEFAGLIARTMGLSEPKFSIPPVFMNFLMSLRAVRRYYGVPKETVIYNNFDVTYDCTNLRQALEGTGLTCPSPRDYIPAMVSFYLANKHRTELHQKMD